MDNESKQTGQLPDNENVAFVPNNIYHDFHNALIKLEKAQRTLHKIEEERNCLKSHFEQSCHCGLDPQSSDN